MAASGFPVGDPNILWVVVLMGMMPPTEDTNPVRRSGSRSPFGSVRGVPKPPALPQQVWINKLKEKAVGDQTDAIGAVISPVAGFSPENGFHNCLISNEQH